MKGVEDYGARRPQGGDQDVGRVESTLLCGTENRGKHLLTLGAARRSIPAAAHFARNDGGPERVLGSPVRRIERRVEEKAEDRFVFGRQMDREAAGVSQAAGVPIEETAEAIHIAAAGDREPVVADDAARVPIARGEGGPEQAIDSSGKWMMGMVQHHRATATEQMRETCLMRGARELAVRRPPVALQDAVSVGAEERGGVRTAAAASVRRQRSTFAWLANRSSRLLIGRPTFAAFRRYCGASFA